MPSLLVLCVCVSGRDLDVRASRPVVVPLSVCVRECDQPGHQGGLPWR